MSKNNTVVIGIAVVAVVIGAVAILSLVNSSVAPTSDVTPTPQPGDQSTQHAGGIVSVAADTLPKAFPTDLPMEKGAEVLQNYQTNNPSAPTASNGLPQSVAQESVREYVTSKTLAQVFSDFDKYFQKNNWTIVTTLDEKDIKSIYAKHELLTANVVIAPNSVRNQNTVNITISYYSAQLDPNQSYPIISTSTIPVKISGH